MMKIEINDISETALLMVLIHAKDAQSRRPILGDTSSMDVLSAIRSADLQTTPQMKRLLQRGRVDRGMSLYINLRAKYYDDAIRDYLKLYPEATVVNIGCGLDGRFDRVDNGQMKLIDLDFADIIDIKKDLFPPSDRYIQIAQSVFEDSWMDGIKGEHVLFLAEGVFMYCEEEDVRELFLKLESRFPGSELLCELFAKTYLKPYMQEISYQLQRFKYGLGREAMFKFGARSGADLTAWSDGINHLSDWSIFDSRHKALGAMSMLRHFDFVRMKIWSARYRFGNSEAKSL